MTDGSQRKRVLMVAVIAAAAAMLAYRVLRRSNPPARRQGAARLAASASVERGEPPLGADAGGLVSVAFATDAAGTESLASTRVDARNLTPVDFLSSFGLAGASAQGSRLSKESASLAVVVDVADQHRFDMENEDVPVGIVPRTNSSPKLKLVNVRDLSPLHVVPPLRLFELDEHLHTARENLELTSPFSSASSSSAGTPREQASERRRQKFLRADQLLRQVESLMHIEQQRVLSAITAWATSSKRAVTSPPLSSLRTFEASVASISLRKLLGEQRSATFLRHFCDHFDQDPSIAKEVSPFSTFLFAKELVVAGNSKALSSAAALLRISVEGLPTAIHARTLPTEEQELLGPHISIMFPVMSNALFYEHLVWFLYAQVLELLPELHQVAPRLAAAQRAFGVQEMSPCVAAYIAALSLSGGNHCDSWSALALALPSLSRDEALVTILGKQVDACQCLGEAIRCANGYVHCTRSELWSDAAAVLAAASANSAPSDPVIVVTRSAHQSFLSSAEDVADTAVLCSRKVCTAQALALPGGSMDAQLWCDLGIMLKVSVGIRSIGERGESALTVEEEMIEVGEMRVGRFECFALSLAIQPTSAETWYRVAVSLDDKVGANSAFSRGAAFVDAKTYERPLLGDGAQPIDRQTALTYSLVFDCKSTKAWFALGATLFDRNGALVQDKAHQVALPKDILSLGPDSAASCAAVPTMEQAALLLSSASEAGAFVLVSAQTAFDKCVELKPSLRTMVNDWLRARQH